MHDPFRARSSGADTKTNKQLWNKRRWNKQLWNKQLWNKQLGPILKRTFSDWTEHESPRLGAALAFYTVLSLAPMVVLVIAVIALGFGQSSAQDQIIGHVQDMIGPDGGNAVRTMIQNAEKPAASLLASGIGILTLLFGASGVFGELRSALNKIWHVKAESKSGIAGLIKERFASFGMLLAIGFLLLVSLVLSVALAALGKFFGQILPAPEFVLSTINFVVSFVAISVLFGLIFKYVPETKIAWRDVPTGAIATAFLFTVGKFLIGLYLGKAGIGSAYGAAGSLIAVIVWVYYSSMIFFFGAELTYVLAHPLERHPLERHPVERHPVAGHPVAGHALAGQARHLRVNDSTSRRRQGPATAQDPR